MNTRRALLRSVAIAAAVVGSLVALALFPLESTVSGARIWVRTLSPGERATYLTPEAIGSIPKEYRRELARTLQTPEQRANFWRGVFTTFRRTHVLTPQQEAALTDAERWLGPSSFTIRGKAERPFGLLTAKRRVAEVLGDRAAKSLFNDAGESTQSSRLPLMERLRYTWRRARPDRLVVWVGLVVPALQAWTCNCVTDEDCSYSQKCHSNVLCEPDTSWPMCGDGWMEPCIKFCDYKEN